MLDAILDFLRELGMKWCINRISRNKLSVTINHVKSTKITKEPCKVWALEAKVRYVLSRFKLPLTLIRIIVWLSLFHWDFYRYSRLESSWKYIVLKWTQLARRVCHSKIDKCELPYWNSGFVSVEWGGAQLTFCSFSPLLVLTPGSLCATYVAHLGEIISAVEFLIYYKSQSFMKNS